MHGRIRKRLYVRTTTCLIGNVKEGRKLKELVSKPTHEIHGQEGLGMHCI